MTTRRTAAAAGAERVEPAASVGSGLSASCGAHRSPALRLVLEIGGRAYAMETAATAAARALFARADAAPLSLEFRDFGGGERLAYLERPLPDARPEALSIERLPAQRGDVAYYAPWKSLSVFLRTVEFSSGFIPVGRLEPAALRALEAADCIRARLRAAPAAPFAGEAGPRVAS